MLRLIATVALVFIFVISIAAQDRATFDTAEAGHAGRVETDDLNASSSGFLDVRGGWARFTWPEIRNSTDQLQSTASRTHCARSANYCPRSRP